MIMLVMIITLMVTRWIFILEDKFECKRLSTVTWIWSWGTWSRFWIRSLFIKINNSIINRWVNNRWSWFTFLGGEMITMYNPRCMIRRWSSAISTSTIWWCGWLHYFGGEWSTCRCISHIIMSSVIMTSCWGSRSSIFRRITNFVIFSRDRCCFCYCCEGGVDLDLRLDLNLWENDVEDRILFEIFLDFLI